jgi:hypothetical protein
VSADHQFGVVDFNSSILQRAVHPCGFNDIFMFPEKHISESKQASKFTTPVRANQPTKFMSTMVQECIYNAKRQLLEFSEEDPYVSKASSTTNKYDE